MKVGSMIDQKSVCRSKCERMNITMAKTRNAPLAILRASRCGRARPRNGAMTSDRRPIGAMVSPAQVAV